MTRQRYVENSSCREICEQSMSIASHPILPQLMSSTEVHKYVQEQRDIIDNFRSQPWPMQMKIAALMMYKENVAKYACKMNTIHTFQDNYRKASGNFLRNLNAITSSLTVWNSIIKQIEGRFGSSVASFFTFLRWLCALNMLMMIMTLSFLILPQIISGYGLQVPDSVKQNGSALSFIVDGKGYLFEYSVLFYGYYDSGRNEPYNPPPHNPDPEIGWRYKLPLAYLGVIVATFILCMIAILMKMAEKYKFLQKANISEQYLFAWKVFASWDHTVTNADTASYKRRHLTILLKETIIEAEARVKGIKWRYILVRTCVQLTVFAVLVVSAYTIYLAVENTDFTANTTSFSDAILLGWRGIWLFARSFQVQAVIVVRNFLLPYLFQLAEYLERHHPRTALKLMLMRLFGLYMTSLYVLIIALFTFNRQCSSGATSNNSTSLLAAWVNVKQTTESTESTDDGNMCCWETSIGQELYKLSLTHLLAELCNIALTDVLRWAVVQANLCPRLTHLIGLAEFNLAENILKLVYGQALVWFGVLFCPFLPAINFFKNVFLFYVRSLVVSIFNRPPHTLFRVASTKTFYMGLLLINVFLCIFPVSYAIIQVVPSTICGPFRGLPSMTHILTNEIATWPTLLQKIIAYTLTPTVILPFIGLQCIIIYYFASLASALKEVNKDIRLQLHLEQKTTRNRIIKDARQDSIYHEEEVTTYSPSLLLRQQQLQKQLHCELSERIKERNSSSTWEEIVPESVSIPRPPRAHKIRVIEVVEEEENSPLPLPRAPSPNPSPRHTSLPVRVLPYPPQGSLEYTDHVQRETVRHDSL